MTTQAKADLVLFLIREANDLLGYEQVRTVVMEDEPLLEALKMETTMWVNQMAVTQGLPPPMPVKACSALEED